LAAVLKLRRIYQPQNPLFWLMLALNTLSFGLVWIVQNRALNMLGMLVVGGFALTNAAIGTWLLWRLLATSPANAPHQDSPSS
jgi:hypothetical protein